MRRIQDGYDVIRRLDGGGAVAFFEVKEIAGRVPASPYRARYRPSSWLLVRGGLASMQPPWADSGVARLLVHPNVVRLFEYKTHEDGWEALLEFVDGPNLRELAEAKALPADIACYIVAECCRALSAGLSLPDGMGGSFDLLHGLISMRSIQISRHGEVKLGGFGFLRLKPENLPRARPPEWGNEVFQCFAPEQVFADPVRPQTDVFLMGAVLHTLLTREPLVQAVDVLKELALGSSATLSRVEPGASKAASPALAQVLAKMLARTPRARFPSAAELLTALEAVPEMRNPHDSQMELARTVQELHPFEPP